jgi:hypothetical protein
MLPFILPPITSELNEILKFIHTIRSVSVFHLKPCVASKLANSTHAPPKPKPIHEPPGGGRDRPPRRGRLLLGRGAHPLLPEEPPRDKQEAAAAGAAALPRPHCRRPDQGQPEPPAPRPPANNALLLLLLLLRTAPARARRAGLSGAVVSGRGVVEGAVVGAGLAGPLHHRRGRGGQRRATR